MATTLHLRLEAAEIDPTSPTIDRSLNPSVPSVSGQVNQTATQNGPIPTPIPMTLGTVDNRPVVFWSRQLQAVTISGDITHTIQVRESNAAANAQVGVYIYRTDYAGTIISLISLSFAGVEMGTGLTAFNTWVATPTNTVLNDGDRLLAIVAFTDADPESFIMAAGFTTQVRYNGAAAGSSDSLLTFTDTLTELATPIGVTHTLPAQGVGT